MYATVQKIRLKGTLMKVKKKKTLLKTVYNIVLPVL